MNAIGVVALASCTGMLAAWLIQCRTRNAGIVDVFWAFGMMLAGSFYAFSGVAPVWLQWTLATMVFLWFLRLGLHILQRVMVESEDGRYRAMRESLGSYSNAGFFAFFQLQAGFVIFLSLPVYAVANTPKPLPVMVVAGTVIALLAFIGETTADRQLKAFRMNPANRGQTCREGWWRYSRHPNYFFEWLHWFAYPLMGLGGPYTYWLWLSPLVMLIFLLFFTGIPFTEQQAVRTRGDNYRAYQAETNMFFPWPSSNKSVKT